MPVRKLGKLPAATIRASYDLEYGSDTLEMHRDAIRPGQHILIVDDLLATGGTARATVNLVKQAGGEIEGVSFLIELLDLSGRGKLVGENVSAVLQYSESGKDRLNYVKMECFPAPVAQVDRASVS